MAATLCGQGGSSQQLPVRCSTDVENSSHGNSPGSPTDEEEYEEIYSVPSYPLALLEEVRAANLRMKTNRAEIAGSTSAAEYSSKEAKDVYVVCFRPADFNSLETEDTRIVDIHTLVENANNSALNFFAKEYGDWFLKTRYSKHERYFKFGQCFWMDGAPESQLRWYIHPELGCLTLEGYDNTSGWRVPHDHSHTVYVSKKTLWSVDVDVRT